MWKPDVVSLVNFVRSWRVSLLLGDSRQWFFGYWLCGQRTCMTFLYIDKGCRCYTAAKEGKEAYKTMEEISHNT